MNIVRRHGWFPVGVVVGAIAAGAHAQTPVAKGQPQAGATLYSIAKQKLMAGKPLVAASTDLGSYSGFRQGDPQYEALVTEIHDATLKAGRKLGGPQAWMNRPGFSFFQGAGETSLIRTGAQVSLGTAAAPSRR